MDTGWLSGFPSMEGLSPPKTQCVWMVVVEETFSLEHSMQETMTGDRL